MSALTKNELFTASEMVEIDVVKGKIQDFLRSVKMPTELIQILKNGILTGGASASLFHGDSPKDWDIYLTSQSDVDSLNKVVTETETVLAMIEDINPKYGVDTLVEGKLITPRAITFKNGIQVITMARADARETFDFVHCMPYYNIKETLYHISRRQYESIKTKQLIHNPKSPQPATYRRQKFLNRGWHD
jgi:hypothetical protein